MKELPAILTLLKTMKQLTVEGLMSHFAASDKYDNATTQLQVKNFQKAQEMLTRAEIYPKWIHMANSSGVLNYKKYEGQIGNLARAGLALYGIDPENKNKQLQPALAFKTKLMQTKQLIKGDTVGYDFTFRAKNPMVIGIVPVGYNDGVCRWLSNIGFMKIRNTYCQIIGTISMNIIAIDVTDVKNPAVGESVIVYSNKMENRNSFAKSATSIDTIAYDLLVGLDASTRRKLVE
jgi:alanine racemase